MKRRDNESHAGDIWSVYDLLQSLRSLGRAGILDQILNTLTAMHDAAVQMIDTSIVRLHQHGACIPAIVSNTWAARAAG